MSDRDIWSTTPPDLTRMYQNDTRFRDCLLCGAMVPSTRRTQHENFHITFSNMKGDDMSRVNWCDVGGHAFRRGEEGSATFSGTQYSNGRPVDIQQDVCAAHNRMNVTVDIEHAIAEQAHNHSE